MGRNYIPVDKLAAFVPHGDCNTLTRGPVRKAGIPSWDGGRSHCVVRTGSNTWAVQYNRASTCAWFRARDFGTVDLGKRSSPPPSPYSPQLPLVIPSQMCHGRRHERLWGLTFAGVHPEAKFDWFKNAKLVFKETSEKSDFEPIGPVWCHSTRPRFDLAVSPTGWVFWTWQWLNLIPFSKSAESLSWEWESVCVCEIWAWWPGGYIRVYAFFSLCCFFVLFFFVSPNSELRV